MQEMWQVDNKMIDENDIITRSTGVEILSKEPELLKNEILQLQKIKNRLEYDIKLTEYALESKPDDFTLTQILQQLNGALSGEQYNYPSRLL